LAYQKYAVVVVYNTLIKNKLENGNKIYLIKFKPFEYGIIFFGPVVTV